MTVQDRIAAPREGNHKVTVRNPQPPDDAAV